MRSHPHAVLGALVVSLLLGGLGACGSNGPDEPAVATPPRAIGAEVIEGEGTFPVTVEHRFGETTIESVPERVVSVGLTEQDILLQFGVVPIAVTEWYGDQPSATWPWAQDLLGDNEPVVLRTTNGIDFEKIADLQPDLIVGTNAGMTDRDYELLSAIAPTVSSVPDSLPYFSPWQDQVLQVARALGREGDGQELVERVEADYAAVAEFHRKDFAGKTATFSQGGPYDGQLYVYPDDLSTAFLTDLGFTITPGLDKYAKPGEQALISAENVNLLEADVIVWATEDQGMFETLQDFATVSQLPAVEENRSVYTDATLAGAIYFLTPLSLEYVLEHLTPSLVGASRGEQPREFPTS
ncbi:iron-siderophore ABC transporter substrate-binding protein [Nocardioides sp. R-C-SC26]|uniref:iron-siderophore ABC transporter substrate-binding protein n=1 Tax=Nocardioides sp. R-C-SC26 TaxID=2870414 RepID=UPI001E434858|nr:iron-siderophore ABC transporter substrate-binding protein [Nocardioides sp. R-C-SC26]